MIRPGFWVDAVCGCAGVSMVRELDCASIVKCPVASPVFGFKM